MPLSYLPSSDCFIDRRENWLFFFLEEDMSFMDSDNIEEEDFMLCTAEEKYNVFIRS